jgi:hypothetical protein
LSPSVLECSPQGFVATRDRIPERAKRRVVTAIATTTRDKENHPFERIAWTSEPNQNARREYRKLMFPSQLKMIPHFAQSKSTQWVFAKPIGILDIGMSLGCIVKIFKLLVGELFAVADITAAPDITHVLSSLFSAPSRLLKSSIVGAKHPTHRAERREVGQIFGMAARITLAKPRRRQAFDASSFQYRRRWRDRAIASPHSNVVKIAQAARAGSVAACGDEAGLCVVHQ